MSANWFYCIVTQTLPIRNKWTYTFAWPRSNTGPKLSDTYIASTELCPLSTNISHNLTIIFPLVISSQWKSLQHWWFPRGSRDGNRVIFDCGTSCSGRWQAVLRLVGVPPGTANKAETVGSSAHHGVKWWWLNLRAQWWYVHRDEFIDPSIVLDKPTVINNQLTIHQFNHNHHWLAMINHCY